MAITEFLNNVTYPNIEQRIDIITNYFDTQKLQLDLESFLKLNNLTKKISADCFDSRGLFYTVNKDLRELIRRYNNDVFYITDSIFRMVNYYNLMNNSTTEDEYTIYEILYRKSARCTCSEIFMYEEKIKNLTRTILHFDKAKTKKYDKFKQELKRQSKINPHVKNFWKTYRKYGQNSYIKFIKQIRNDEIHNDSVIDKYTDVQTLAPGVTSFCDTHYVISNDVLYTNIQQALLQQVKLKDSLQIILDNYKL